MGKFRFLRGMVGAACIVVAISAAAPSGAMASGVKLCVSEKEGGAVKTPKAGVCAKGYKLTEFGGEGKAGEKGEPGPKGEKGEPGPEGKFAGLTESEKETLLGILPCIRFESEGIDKKPTVQFTKCNVQVESGEAKEETLNGEGNLVVGLDASPGTQTGSNNLVVGGLSTYTSYGAVVGGYDNTSSGEYSTVFEVSTRRPVSAPR